MISLSPTRRPELVELETFLVAARAGSLARTGEELLISKTAVAKRIASLESILGVRLLERTARGVWLTDPGRRLVPEVEQLLADTDRTLRAAAELWSEDEALGRPISFLYASPDPDRELEEIAAELQSGRSLHAIRRERRTKDGRVIMVELTISPVRDPEGNLIGSATIARDVARTGRQRRSDRDREDA